MFFGLLSLLPISSGKVVLITGCTSGASREADDSWASVASVLSAPRTGRYRLRGSKGHGQERQGLWNPTIARSPEF